MSLPEEKQGKNTDRRVGAKSKRKQVGDKPVVDAKKPKISEKEAVTKARAVAAKFAEENAAAKREKLAIAAEKEAVTKARAVVAENKAKEGDVGTEKIKEVTAEPSKKESKGRTKKKSEKKEVKQDAEVVKAVKSKKRVTEKVGSDKAQGKQEVAKSEKKEAEVADKKKDEVKGENNGTEKKGKAKKEGKSGAPPKEKKEKKEKKAEKEGSKASETGWTCDVCALSIQRGENDFHVNEHLKGKKHLKKVAQQTAPAVIKEEKKATGKSFMVSLSLWPPPPPVPSLMA
jgi:hypothetical protein